MPYAVKNLSTNSYWTSSHAKGVDYTDVRFAKVYLKESTARGVAKQIQNTEIHHYDNEQWWINSGKIPYENWEPGYTAKPDWQAVDLDNESV